MSVKIILRKEEKADGTYPLAIRITKNRKSSYIYLDHSIKPDQWDKQAQKVKRSHPNHVRLNNYLLKKLSEASNKTLEAETEKDHVSSKAVRQKIKPKTGETFFAQAQDYLNDLKASGKYTIYSADKPRIKHFREFMGGQDIAFSDISQSMIEKFKVYLKRPDQDGVTMSERTAVNHLVMIRSIFAHARKSNPDVDKYYPFGRGKIKIKFPESIKIGLTAEEVKRMEELQLEGYENHCRNLWLFSFYFAGMRVGDVLSVKWSNFQDGRFYYAMNKNNKADSLKVSPKVQAILDQYEAFKDNKNDLVFPELKKLDNLDDTFNVKRNISFAVRDIDECLRLKIAEKAQIKKHLTMHVARHTFGNISGDKIPIQMLQKLYRHTHISTTIGYQQNFIHKDTDDALDAVLNPSL